MASQADGEQQLEAAQLISGAPWNTASGDSAAESVTQLLAVAPNDATLGSEPASQTDGGQQLQTAAAQLISGAPERTASGGLAPESLTRSLAGALNGPTLGKDTASQTDGGQQLQTAAAQLINGAPGRTASGGSATESLTRPLTVAPRDATNMGDPASQTDGGQQFQTAATQSISGAPGPTASGGSTTESLTLSLVEALQDATNSVNNLTAFQQNQAESTAQSVEGMLTNVAGGQSVLDAAASSGGGVADSLLSGGSLLSPIISGIMSLFGSGSSSTPAPLETFTMPPALDVDATGGQMTGGQLAERLWRQWPAEGADNSADNIAGSLQRDRAGERHGQPVVSRAEQ
jgi:hypothetical protein